MLLCDRWKTEASLHARVFFVPVPLVLLGGRIGPICTCGHHGRQAARECLRRNEVRAPESFEPQVTCLSNSPERLHDVFCIGRHKVAKSVQELHLCRRW